MKTKDLITFLRTVKPREISQEYVDEIIQCLRERDDLLRLIENLRGVLKNITDYVDGFASKIP